MNVPRASSFFGTNAFSKRLIFVMFTRRYLKYTSRVGLVRTGTGRSASFYSGRIV